MIIRTHKDLPIGKEVFAGTMHYDVCNRYLRREDGIIEVQHLYRFGNDSKTKEMTAIEFDDLKKYHRS